MNREQFFKAILAASMSNLLIFGSTGLLWWLLNLESLQYTLTAIFWTQCGFWQVYFVNRGSMTTKLFQPNEDSQ